MVRRATWGLRVALKCWVFGATLLPVVSVALCVLWVVGLALAWLDLALLHILLGQPVWGGVEKPWEVWFTAACVGVSVVCGLAGMLGWWCADLKHSSDPNVRVLPRRRAVVSLPLGAPRAAERGASTCTASSGSRRHGGRRCLTG